MPLLRDEAKTSKRTPEAYFKQLLYLQRYRSKKKNFQPPTYTWDELKDWLDAQPNTVKVWNDWVNSGYQQELCPSIDRIDNKKGYSLDNIQLMTFQQNRAKGHQDVINGEQNTGMERVAVQGFYPDGSLQGTYASINEAARQTGMSAQTIGRHAKGIYKRPLKIYWRYT